MDDNKLIANLESFVTERRKLLFEHILEHRTRYITVALEDIYQSQNASAVLRTADCFGIQDIHIIENRNEYQINPDVSLGSDKWLSLFKYNATKNNTREAVKKLRKSGYRLIATTPHGNTTTLPEFDLTKGKIALFFGTELQGLSDDLIEQADERLRIPLYGFTESFNISVSAAIILHTLTERLRASSISWKLSSGEKKQLKLEWLRNSIKNAQLIEKDYRGETAKNQNITPKA